MADGCWEANPALACKTKRSFAAIPKTQERVETLLQPALLFFKQIPMLLQRQIPLRNDYLSLSMIGLPLFAPMIITLALGDKAISFCALILS